MNPPKKSGLLNKRVVAGKRNRIFLLFSVLFLFFNCSNTTTPDTNIVTLNTDKTSYIANDTIAVSIKNNTKDNYNFLLRCGGYLEMFFQKYENGKWSENKWFWFMSLRCPSVVDTLLPSNTFKYKLPVEWFKDTGEFRLQINDIYSNNFYIE